MNYRGKCAGLALVFSFRQCEILQLPTLLIVVEHHSLFSYAGAINICQIKLTTQHVPE